MNEMHPDSYRTDPRDAGRSQPSGDEAFDLVAIVQSLWRGKWLIGVFVLLFGYLGWYYGNNIAQPLYTSTTRLAFEVRAQQVVDVESVLSGVSRDLSAINTELEVIRSRGVIGRLVDELNLVEDTEFNELGPSSPYSISAIRARIRALFRRGDAAPVATSAPDPEVVRLRTILNFRDRVQVRQQRGTYLFDILVTTGDRTKSAELANALARIYIKSQEQAKIDATAFAVDWLGRRVIELEGDLETQDDKIKTLRAETELTSPEALEALNLRTKDVRDRLEEARNAVTRSEAAVVALSAAANVRDIDAALAATEDTTLRRLAGEARSSNAAQATFFTRVDTLIQRAALEGQRARAQQEALIASFEDLQTQVAEQSADLSALNQLIREFDATSVLYETFLTRLKETSVQVGLQRADSRVLSAAVRGSQVAPRRLRILAMCMMIGFAIGAAIVLAKQFLHSGFRTPSDLEDATGYSVLGQIPRAPVRQRDKLLTYLSDKPTSATAESIRNLRTSVLLSNVDQPPQVIMSTSSIPGEGKTTQSIALAHNLSGMNRRVLLIEGDIRRRTFNEYFTPPERGGLASVIAGEIGMEQVITHDKTLGADVLMGEKSQINAADLFSSKRFMAFIEHVRQVYDHVIIDTPPVLVVPDARIIGLTVDATIYTVRWDSTSRTQVRDGLRQLSSVGVRITGLVLSQIDARRMKSYGYGGRYGAYSSYGAGYYDIE